MKENVTPNADQSTSIISNSDNSSALSVSKVWEKLRSVKNGAELCFYLMIIYLAVQFFNISHLNLKQIPFNVSITAWAITLLLLLPTMVLCVMGCNGFEKKYKKSLFELKAATCTSLIISLSLLISFFIVNGVSGLYSILFWFLAAWFLGSVISFYRIIRVGNVDDNLFVAVKQKPTPLDYVIGILASVCALFVALSIFVSIAYMSLVV